MNGNLTFGIILLVLLMLPAIIAVIDTWPNSNQTAEEK